MRYLILLIFFIYSCFCFAIQNDSIYDSKFPSYPPYLDSNNFFWADSILAKMTIDEKIGQCFFIRANSTTKKEDENYFKMVDNLIKDYHIGGLIFFKSNPKKIIDLVNRFQSISKIPLINSIDGEWGVSMRIDSTQVFPWAMTLGAIQNDDLIYKMGEEIANQFKSMGLHMNFAPVSDVNNNPNNPVIGRRSFGEDPYLVSQKSLVYMKALQDNNILACAKHFPGHGDTDVDSHDKLPIINHNQSRLDSIELYPFNDLIFNGLGAIMTAHINLPKIDKSKLPASLSSSIINDLLKKKLNFKGLVVTDGLNMGGVKSNYQNGEVEFKAFMAGNDILLFPEYVPEAILMIKEAYNKGDISEEYINKKCRKILLAKKWLGLDNRENIFPNSDSIVEKLNTQESEFIERELCKSSIIVLKNENTIPIDDFVDKQIAYVHLGNDSGDVFFESLDRYSSVDKFQFHNNKEELIKKLKNYDVVICGIHFKNKSPFSKHKLSRLELSFLKRISTKSNNILTLFSSPYLLNDLSKINNFSSIILSHQNNFSFQDLSAQLIFGSFSSKGKMPVSSGNYVLGDGLSIETRDIISFSLPIDVGMDKNHLKQIDSIVNSAIKIQATPGAQVLIAKDGKIIYNKCFGYHTYDSIQPVLYKDIYDLASLTKIFAAAPIFMNLMDQSKIHLNNSLDGFFNLSDTSDKKNISFLDIFTHQAQLPPWIPFHNLYRNETGQLNDTIFSKKQGELFSLKVANNLFFRRDFTDTIINVILKTPLRKKKGYKYSDLGFYLFYKLLKDNIGIDVENYVKKEFYSLIDAYRIHYNPMTSYFKKNIIPTENDKLFRHQLIQGYVHDPGAALFGGIGLHAGLFSNSIDLAKLMQLYLNNGLYNGKQILSEERIIQFTKAPFKDKNNRRGIFFDKPSINPNIKNTCDEVSDLSFGHTGFTGTMVWADPKHEIIYIFLSNRVFPNQDNWKLVTENFRTKIQSIIYESLIN